MIKATDKTKAYLAVIFICIVWGTTYLAIKVGVNYYPAFLFGGIRQTLGGALLLLLSAAFNRERDLSWNNISRQMIAGFLMITLGNGCVTWGEKYIPSGIAALICAMMPIFAVTFNLITTRNERPNLLIGLGLLTGIIGVGLIFRNNISGLANPAYLMGILSVLFATSSWAAGSVFNKKKANPLNPMFNASLQLIFGGIFMLIISGITERHQNVDLWQPQALLSLAYLSVFGSALAFTAYMFALRSLPVGIATIYAYVNPLVAVILGYLILSEDLNIYTGLAFVSIATSVFFVNKGYRKQHKTITTKQKLAVANTAPVES